jgi:hypothetical protein
LGILLKEKIMNDLISLVDRLFEASAVPHGNTWRNPVTEGRFVSGIDPIHPQKEAARRALAAREWFKENGPPDAPPLPLSEVECSACRVRSVELSPAVREKRHGFDYIVASYAKSLERRNYDFLEHPSFEDYARGVLASPYTYSWIKEDEHLKELYPPRELPGLGKGLYWSAVS